jgi:hypothetical protein
MAEISAHLPVQSLEQPEEQPDLERAPTTSIHTLSQPIGGESRVASSGLATSDPKKARIPSPLFLVDRAL